ncbi:carbonic anhydrase-related protein 10 isoform X2 [Planococcus citri]|uniref:carbonic anhydrase-related protein 10 isoform X2 n=1 Tax=Planococcus citri TaxID=170843 RepID=UPI0031F88552
MKQQKIECWNMFRSASILAIFFIDVTFGNWEEWWTYDGISGPEYWGRLNPDWGLCNKGRRQSPINVDPTKLLFDPFLPAVDINKETISGMLINTGQSLVFRVDKENKNHVNITGGPLAYRYQFEEFYIHFGSTDNSGSEHKIGGYTFPAEIQLYGYNSELYHNMSEAQQKAQGTVGISIMVQIANESSPSDIRIITTSFKDVKFKGNKIPIQHLSFQHFLPETISYMTYEGSLTYPGCWETTVWIILNKPIFITKSELYALRNLKRGSKEASLGPLGDNSRPTQGISNRTVRTNIDFKKITTKDEKICDVSMKRKVYYTANSWIDRRS